MSAGAACPGCPVGKLSAASLSGYLSGLLSGCQRMTKDNPGRSFRGYPLKSLDFCTVWDCAGRSSGGGGGKRPM